ncbi:MAG: aminotransferase class I/II-fold pyridoxal phosphate-dependent enzyme [Paracoccus sp. (in: a-proteobacteria)]|uniref:trans-sulfuration enzyme family protein n=1 Tax=Paracoccus sp. TaxID=267 RepID=UPI0026E0071E|nr:aminotransferase class I/II-fold pyridoxal phosphate-dependent enzyme [Paracoccus sp. (in: a-proteobacteria)]MDO5620131.1 aminotransferase class I/II-fold pyridoxal phosphate-dependent enzyme [Paracoccus sp. (in: a-proteobacteria)]
MSTLKDVSDCHPRTRAVHQAARRSQYGEVAEALYMTQGFVYDSAEQAEARFVKSGPDEFIYARYGNPTSRIFEDRLASLEGTEDCFATASGMAAVNGALMAVAEPGKRIVAASALFGSCIYVLEILKTFGVDVVFVDGTNLDQWRAAINAETVAVFFETVSNPGLEVADMPAIAELAHAVGALVMVDNVFATPVFSRAVEQGADVIIYSTTKHIDGGGRALGGAICGRSDFVRGKAEPYLKHTGGAISPFNAWLMLNGLTSMDLRVRQQAETALIVAERLSGNPAFSQVIYPGLANHAQHDLAMRLMGSGGTMIALELAGGKDAAFRLLDGLRIVTISNNLGDARSIITHPATTTHQRLSDEAKAQLGITPGLVRLSIGLEHADDLIRDIEQALAD